MNGRHEERFALRMSAAEAAEWLREAQDACGDEGSSDAEHEALARMVEAVAAALPDPERRLAHALDLAAKHDSDWPDAHVRGDGPESLARGRYAVKVERDDESWLVAADTAVEVGDVILDTFAPDLSYREWVETIFDLETGEVADVRWSDVRMAVDVDGVTVTSGS